MVKHPQSLRSQHNYTVMCYKIICWLCRMTSTFNWYEATQKWYFIHVLSIKNIMLWQNSFQMLRALFSTPKSIWDVVCIYKYNQHFTNFTAMLRDGSGCWIMWPCYGVQITVWHSLFVYFVSQCIHWAIPTQTSQVSRIMRDCHTFCISCQCYHACIAFKIVTHRWPPQQNFRLIT